MTLAKTLREMNACSDAVIWVKDRNLTTAWNECERADWMLWLCGRMVGKEGWPTRQKLVLAACDCAETAKQYWRKGDKRPANAIKTARAWARGKATIKKVRNAYAAAYAAAADADAAAAYAAAAYAYAAAAAAYAYAAAAAAYAAYYAAYAAKKAKHETHLKMCKLIRKRLTPGKIA
jgi:hypothetical protein